MPGLLLYGICSLCSLQHNLTIHPIPFCLKRAAKVLHVLAEKSNSHAP